METITGFFTAVPLDYFLLGGIVIGIALDSLRSGIGRACALAVGLPIAMLLYSLLKPAIFIGSLPLLSATPMAQAATVAVMVVLSYFLARRMGLEFVSGGMGEPVQSLIAGVVVAVIFTVVWLNLPELGLLWNFNEQIGSLFAEQFRLIWLLGAYAALAFARG